MSMDLVYDAASTSTAPASLLKVGLALFGLSVVWGAWVKMGGGSLHWGVKMLAIMGIVVLAVSALSRYEQYTLATRTDVRVAEGPVLGTWRQTERRRESGTSRYRNTYWEGFSINGIPFVYQTDLEQNYFHNAGPTAIEMKDGLYLRLRYVEERDGSQVRNQIIRVEKARMP